MSSNNVIDQTVAIRASRDKVFMALTESEILTRWFLSKAESDPRTGGYFKYSWEFEKAEENGFQEGVYKNVISGQEISYPWQVQPAPADPTRVTITLTENGEETVLHLVHSGWDFGAENEALIENHARPWSFYLQNLKDYLENEDDNRAEVIKQVTY
jgi:uncharacterized protein YndB with AHSA1/START domain